MSSNLDLLAELSASRLMDTVRTEKLNKEPESLQYIPNDAIKEAPDAIFLDESNTNDKLLVHQEPSNLTKESLIITFDEFVKLYPSYPVHSALVFKIFTDLLHKNSLQDLTVEDGAKYFQSKDYFFYGKVNNKNSNSLSHSSTSNKREGKMRYIFPIESSESIDLMW